MVVEIYALRHTKCDRNHKISVWKFYGSFYFNGILYTCRSKK